MPEETIQSTEPKKRRSNSAPAEESGGGKLLPIILVVAVLGLAFALYKRNASAGEQAETDAKAMLSLSNQLSEARSKLAAEQGGFTLSQNNQVAALTRRTAEFFNVSNLLVQARQRWEDKQQEANAAHAEVSSKAAAIALLDAQQDELQRRVAAIPGLQSELAEVKEKLNRMYSAQASIYDQLGRARLEASDLERKLADPLFLRLQERRLLETAEVRQKAAAKERIDTSDPRVSLELQPDGSVRPAYGAR